MLSNKGCASSVPDQRAKIPPAWGPGKKKEKQRQYCNKFNNDFKNGPHQKKKPLKKGSKFRREKNTNINSFFKTSHNVPFNYMLMVHSSAKILKIIYSLW